MLDAMSYCGSRPLLNYKENLSSHDQNIMGYLVYINCVITRLDVSIVLMLCWSFVQLNFWFIMGFKLLKKIFF